MHVYLDNFELLHPTAQKLVDNVIAMLETTPYTKIKSETVLTRSGISRGPLYHHFQDFNGLISEAHTQIYRSTADQFTNEIYKGVSAATSRKGALRSFMSALDSLVALDSASQRRVLLGVLHDAMSSPNLREDIGAMQGVVTERWTKIHELCKSRGWASNKSEGKVVALSMEAALFGCTLDDLSPDSIERDIWIQTLKGLFQYFFLDNGDEI